MGFSAAAAARFSCGFEKWDSDFRETRFASTFIYLYILTFTIFSLNRIVHWNPVTLIQPFATVIKEQKSEKKTWKESPMVQRLPSYRRVIAYSEYNKVVTGFDMFKSVRIFHSVGASTELERGSGTRQCQLVSIESAISA